MFHIVNFNSRVQHRGLLPQMSLPILKKLSVTLLPRSQSLNRIVALRNRCCCICPASRLWLRRRRRLMTYEEKWGLQGMPLSRHTASLESAGPSLPHVLAGNGWNYFNFLPAMLPLCAQCPSTGRLPSPECQLPSVSLSHRLKSFDCSKHVGATLIVSKSSSTWARRQLTI